MENDASSSIVVHFVATVFLEKNAVLSAELQKFCPFFMLEVVRADDNFSKFVFFMDLFKVLQRPENAETVAVAVAEVRVAVDEADDVFPSGAINVDGD